MISQPHIHFCANVIVQRVVVQIQEYNTHTKDTPFNPFICVCDACQSIQVEHLKLSLKRKFVSVYVLADNGEGKQIAAL